MNIKGINKLYHHSLNADEASQERSRILWMDRDGSGHMLLVIFSKFAVPAEVSRSV